MGSDSQDVQQHIGCGAEINLSQITLNINTTTGGCFSVNVDSHISIESLKKIVAKKLKVAKDRICLLHREKELHDGTSLRENGIANGSKIILLPNVETGLLAQRPENTVMQALESLNDTQVNDFLSGKTPLNLSMRLGDHMMLIQLQLSTVNSSSASTSSSSSSSSTIESQQTNEFVSRPTMSRSSSDIRREVRSLTRDRTLSRESLIQSTSRSSGEYNSTSNRDNQTKQQTDMIGCDDNQQKDLMISTEDFESLRNIVSSLSSIQDDDKSIENDAKDEHESQLLDQSPIKSLSNLVSNPIKTIPIANIPTTSTNRTIDTTSYPSDSLTCSDPISAKLTSCLCKSFENNSNSSCNNECQYTRTEQQIVPMQTKLKTTRSSSALLRRTLNNPIARNRSQGFQQVNQRQTQHSTFSNRTETNIIRSCSSDNLYMTETTIDETVIENENALFGSQSAQDIDSGNSSATTILEGRNSGNLAEASRNLAKTLRNLSKEVFTNKMSTLTNSDEVRSRDASTSNRSTTNTSESKSFGKVGSISGIGSGAVIESMRNHGRGIYSGTFSGTLNPALQDRFGRPKRDISTVIHILNDLLSATPHYSRGARISFEPAQNVRSGSKYTSSSTSSSTSFSKRPGNLNSQSISHRQCTKCITRGNKFHKDCTIANELIKANSSRRSTLGIATKSSSSLPSTPGNSYTPTNSIDCHQCHKRLTNSAPVSPIATNQSINFDDSFNTDSLNSSTSSNTLFQPIHSLGSSSTDLTTTSLPTSTLSQVNPICIKCSSIEMENNKTKSKLNQLRLVMQQRRERREARKIKAAPYGGRIIGTSATPTQTTTANNNDAHNNSSVIQGPIDGPPTNPIVEHVDTLA